MRAILSALLMLSGCAGFNSLSNDNKPVPVASATLLTTSPQPSVSASPSGPVETPTPSETLLTSTPEPFIPTGTPTPAPSTANIFFESEPKELCFGETVTVKGKYDSDTTFSIYLEKKVMRADKLPPLYNEHVLLSKVNVKTGVEFLYPFTVQRQMRDAGDQHVLNISPAEYFVVIQSETLDTYGTRISIKDCQK
jgi:hypothetical protein